MKIEIEVSDNKSRKVRDVCDIVSDHSNDEVALLAKLEHYIQQDKLKYIEKVGGLSQFYLNMFILSALQYIGATAIAIGLIKLCYSIWH